MLSLLPCPDQTCGSPAEVIDRVALESTDGPIEHVKTSCVRGLVFFMPAPVGYPTSQRPRPAVSLVGAAPRASTVFTAREHSEQQAPSVNGSGVTGHRVVDP
jgi:hypothetical protein